MLKNPIPEVTNKFQHRAIGIVNGNYVPYDSNQINKGLLTDKKGVKLETVVLGKAISLLKKHIDLNKSYFWIVYPKNKNTHNLHLQVAGIWDPYDLNDFPKDSSKKKITELLEELSLNDNYFSVRGELVFINIKKKEIVIKINHSPNTKNPKNKNFKLVIKGELSLDLLNSFVSLEVLRDGNFLKLVKYEVIEKNLSKNYKN